MERESSLVWGAVLGTLSVVNVYNTVDNAVSYNQLRNAVIQKRISEAPELSDKVMENIRREVAEKVPRDRLVLGMFLAFATGMTVTGAVTQFANAYSSKMKEE